MAGPAHHSYDLDPTQKLLVTVGVIAGMLMQVLDTTIANVALPHMQASLGATRDTISWVLTSYIVASAIAIPITGWLSDRVGRKPLFIWSVLAFTVASLLCAIATSLTEIVVFRAFQGVAGAFLVPLAQSTMFDINPPEKHGRAMAIFGMGVMIGPILGPVIGGWLTDSYNWRWVFLINLPVGIVAALLMLRGLPDTQRVKRPFDIFGFLLIAFALAGLQLMLDRGEQNDWFASWETMIELGVAIGCTWMFIVHMATSRTPIFDPIMFKDRNFAASLVFMGVTGVMLLAGLALLPPLLQSLFGYSVLQSGFLTAPRGVGTLVSMMIVGRVVGKIDPRLIILGGIGLMALSLWQMSGFSLEMDSRPIIVSGVIQGFALGFIFVPLNTIAFGTLDPRYRTTGSALLNLSRNVGGSIGISVVTVLLAQNVQISHSDLAAHITPYSIPQFLQNVVNAAPGVTDTAVAMVDAEVNRQALMIAYIDDFKLMMIISLFAMPLLLLLRKGRQGGGGHAVMD
ncbi:DHA2 family efflux MFS transporter permease subunit [Sphingosinicella ginsenosidimutans]|uniref:DHA2 family efflux MFS transporter permease subunit n=1 Tax=Allosphingosinicella ginsenosidimutans TaxID=1176539 RepID=A0A5C6TR50_9SPHN|nr:DHA2 family efflux MFS transporter permease subunit [Sphingosinicella ginsenosidimutans]TXC62650.1 DHA2 family efflux MFS transporter permease subunit [Sphingosinicella ginsenosidimutans]